MGIHCGTVGWYLSLAAKPATNPPTGSAVCVSPNLACWYDEPRLRGSLKICESSCCHKRKEHDDDIGSECKAECGGASLKAAQNAALTAADTSGQILTKSAQTIENKEVWQQPSDPVICGPENSLRPAGLEPATSWFEATRSIQLRYGRCTLLW